MKRRKTKRPTPPRAPGIVFNGPGRGTTVLSEVRRFFRHCPNCGRRFEIHLVEKKEVPAGEEEVSVSAVPNPVPSGMVEGGPQPGGFVNLQGEGAPVVVLVREFRSAYRCGHCGHMWTEQEFKD
jgi:predicted RNA-binding Zn-ribbon protein involved in translation (DUF1610 family)